MIYIVIEDEGPIITPPSGETAILNHVGMEVRSIHVAKQRVDGMQQ